MRASKRLTDLAPVGLINCHEDNFGHLQADIINLWLLYSLFKYTLVFTGVQLRYG
jgi:hypothetical protein